MVNIMELVEEALSVSTIGLANFLVGVRVGVVR